MKKLLLLLSIISTIEVHSQINWSPLDNGTDGAVNDIIVFNNELYAAGQFSIVGGMVRPNIAKWNGSAWITVGGPNAIINDEIYEMIVYNNELYILGRFTAAGTNTLNGIAKWNGSTWVSVGFPGLYGIFFSAVVYNGNLITLSLSSGNPNNTIHKYNGTSWVQIGTSLTAYGGPDWPLCIYNNELYAAGNYTASLPFPPGNNSGISKWNGTTWSDVGGLVVSPPIYVNAMEVHNNELYIGGIFNTVGGIAATNVAKYNGSTWSVAHVGNNIGVIRSMLSYSNNLYIGGLFPNNPPIRQVEILNGSSFVPLTQDCLTQNCATGEVRSLCFYNNSLHVGGYFGFVATGPPYTLLKNIARFSGSVGIKEQTILNNHSVYPNPSTGQFNFEGLVEESSIEVTDLTGRVIYTSALDESKNSINLQGMPSGLYLYKLRNKQNQVQQGKLILE